MITLVTNLKAGAATTQYTNFYYNSMVKFNHKYLCANSEGLFEVTGNTDNGSAIVSYFEPVTMDFNITSNKRLRAFYIGYESSGDLTLTINTEKNLSEVIIIPGTTGRQAKKVNISRYVTGRYWTFQIKSDGPYFSVDHISVLPVIRSHGIDQN